MDRHKLWRIVGSNFRGFEEGAPEGYKPVVEVFLGGRSEPVRLAQVQTSRNADFPWTFLASSGEDSESPTRDDYLVFVNEGLIERIEIRFVRSEEAGIGFSHQVLSDEEEA